MHENDAEKDFTLERIKLDISNITLAHTKLGHAAKTLEDISLEDPSLRFTLGKVRYELENMFIHLHAAIKEVMYLKGLVHRDSDGRKIQ